MITGPLSSFLDRCRERGYSLEEVRECVISIDGGNVTVDTDHVAYPRQPKLGFSTNPEKLVAAGPGAQLAMLLKRFGIEPTPTCHCRAKAAEMDAWGPDECAKPERIEEVLAVMREEAKARGLPFLDVAGRLLIRRAISNARRAAATPQQGST